MEDLWCYPGSRQGLYCYYFGTVQGGGHVECCYPPGEAHRAGGCVDSTGLSDGEVGSMNALNHSMSQVCVCVLVPSHAPRVFKIIPLYVKMHVLVSFMFCF